MTRSFALATAAALSLSLAASAAHAGPMWGCDDEFGCGMNGRYLNGIEEQGVWGNGIWSNSQSTQGLPINGMRQGTTAERPAVRAVVLPSGETIDLR